MRAGIERLGGALTAMAEIVAIDPKYAPLYERLEMEYQGRHAGISTIARARSVAKSVQQSALHSVQRRALTVNPNTKVL